MSALPLPDEDALAPIQLRELHHPVHELQTGLGARVGENIRPNPVNHYLLRSHSISNTIAMLGNGQARSMG